MSIKDSNTVDFISIDLNGNAVLTIADDLEWDEKNEHLLLLQEKLNVYLAFIESGEIYEQFPQASNREIGIAIVAKYHPTEIARTFLQRIKDALKDAGYGFEFRVLPAWIG